MYKSCAQEIFRIIQSDIPANKTIDIVTGNSVFWQLYAHSLRCQTCGKEYHVTFFLDLVIHEKEALGTMVCVTVILLFKSFAHFVQNKHALSDLS